MCALLVSSIQESAQCYSLMIYDIIKDRLLICAKLQRPFLLIRKVRTNLTDNSQ